MTVNLSPIWGAGAQLLDNSGNVLSGGKIYTYAAGTTTQVTTYTSNTGVTANSNPIVLNSAGRVPYEIWLTDGQNYKFVLKDSNDVLIGTWDNLSGINSNFVAYTNQQEIQTATAGQTVFNLTTMQYLPGTGNLSVFVDGVNQYGPGAQYAFEETDQTTVTFASGLHVGASVKFTSTQIQNAGVADASQISYTYPDVNAVTENVEDRLSKFIYVTDFGAIADAVVTGNDVTGTDNLDAFTNALNAATSTGISTVIAPGGFYYLSNGITLPRGVTLQGEGTSHLPIVTQSSYRTGTCLLINGTSSADCIAFESNAGHSGITNLSVYNTNDNAIRSVVSIIGQLYPSLTNVEIGCLKKTTGVGLYIAPATTGGNYATLWGAFYNVVVTCTNIGSATEASVRWGLYIYGYTPTDVCNANSFVSGQFNGTWGGLLVDGAINGSGALSCVFQGTKFDTNYDGTYSPQWVPNADGLFGWLEQDCYIYPVVKIVQGVNIAFHACYFEVGGSPVNYNDGTHGTAPLLGAAIIDNATNCQGVSFIDSGWNGCYQYDKGIATLITPTTSFQRYDTRFATHLKESQTTNQSLTSSVWTKLNFGTAVFGNGSDLSWDNTNKNVQIKSYGTYLITATVYFDGSAIASGNTASIRAVASSGYTLSGTIVPSIGAGISTVSTLTGTLNLYDGDTIQFDAIQTSGSSLNVIGGYSTFSVVKIG